MKETKKQTAYLTIIERECDQWDCDNIPYKGWEQFYRDIFFSKADAIAEAQSKTTRQP